MNLQTERLLLREFTLSDVTDFANLMADPEVMRFSLQGPLNKEQAEKYFEKRVLSHYKEHGFGLFALFLKENKKFIGFSGLIRQTIDGKQEIELAYRLHPQFWSQGFATEAAIAVTEYAFQKLHPEYLISIIDPNNERSLKVAKRIGMQFWKETLFHGIPVHVYQKFAKPI